MHLRTSYENNYLITRLFLSLLMTVSRQNKMKTFLPPLNLVIEFITKIPTKSLNWCNGVKYTLYSNQFFVFLVQTTRKILLFFVKYKFKQYCLSLHIFTLIYITNIFVLLNCCTF